MRQKRAKTYRKLMSLYCMTFGFRQPYQVLVDSEICKESVSSKLDLAKHLGVVLQGTVKPMITQCCIHELYLQGKSQQPAVDLAKAFERRKCNHREAIPGDECLSSVVGETNKHRYVIASQSQPLRAKLRKIPAVPIVHITRSVMVLEPPSDRTLETKESAEEQALLIPEVEKASLSTDVPAEPPKKKRKGPKGPNPLSMKKKKVKLDAPVSSGKTDGGKVSRTKDKPTNNADTVKSGPKRTREDVDSHSEYGQHDQAGENEEARTGGHRRKRRRNNQAVSEGGNVEG